MCDVIGIENEMKENRAEPRLLGIIIKYMHDGQQHRRVLANKVVGHCTYDATTVSSGAAMSFEPVVVLISGLEGRNEFTHT